MHGNVWEWCADWYRADRYRGTNVDPCDPGEASRRVSRGGSFCNSGRYCRSAVRNCLLPTSRHPFVGFRVRSPRRIRTERRRTEIKHYSTRQLGKNDLTVADSCLKT